MSLPRGMVPFDWKHWECPNDLCRHVRQTVLMEVQWEDRSTVMGKHEPPSCPSCELEMIPCSQKEFELRLTKQ